MTHYFLFIFLYLSRKYSYVFGTETNMSFNLGKYNHNNDLYGLVRIFHVNVDYSVSAPSQYKMFLRPIVLNLTIRENNMQRERGNSL
jgi:hypothetical protein